MAGDALDVYADRTRVLPVIDPHGRALIITCDAALAHLQVALPYFGSAGAIELLPAPETPELIGLYPGRHHPPSASYLALGSAPEGKLAVGVTSIVERTHPK